MEKKIDEKVAEILSSSIEAIIWHKMSEMSVNFSQLRGKTNIYRQISGENSSV